MFAKNRAVVCKLLAATASFNYVSHQMHETMETFLLFHNLISVSHKSKHHSGFTNAFPQSFLPQRPKRYRFKADIRLGLGLECT